MDWFCKKKAEVEKVTDLNTEEATQAMKANRVDDALNRLIELDEQEREDLKGFIANVQVSEIKGKTKIALGDQWFFADYCLGVKVKDIGNAPKVDNYFASFGHSSCSITGATQAVVAAEMASGKVVAFYCSRHIVDEVYSALNEAYLKSIGLK